LILACGLTLAVTGLTTLLVAAGASRDASATVRSVIGTATYQGPDGGDFKPLKVNQILTPGTTVKSGANSAVYMSVNGLTSTVKVTENTTMTLTSMLMLPANDSSTTLKLDGGTLLGSVRKLSANSDYKVTVPNGVAAIRGTDWQVSVALNPATGTYTITFTSVTGTIVCQVTPPPGAVGGPGGRGGGPVIRTLNTGQSWTVTATITTTVVGQPPVVTTISIGAVMELSDQQLAALVAQELGLTYVVYTGNPPQAGGLAPPGYVGPPGTGGEQGVLAAPPPPPPPPPPPLPPTEYEGQPG